MEGPYSTSIERTPHQLASQVTFAHASATAISTNPKWKAACLAQPLTQRAIVRFRRFRRKTLDGLLKREELSTEVL